MIDEETINMLAVVDIPVASLTLAGSPRLSGESSEHIEALAAAQEQLPPILVHRSSMRVIDGAHRVRVAQRRGDATVPGRLFDGDEAEAFVLAVTLNISHGLPLTLAERKQAAQRIIASYSNWSDRRVASAAGISPRTVAEIRKRTAGEVEQGASRIGQDGRRRPLDSTTGRQLARHLITENPHLSLREVARAASISPETVRDVRNRMRNGEGPLPERRDRSADDRNCDDARFRPAPTDRLTAGRASNRRQEPPIDRATIVNRLKADPALRYTDTGRNLLRLLALHTLWTAEWEGIVNNVPPHCVGIVSDLARQFAELWTDFATRADGGTAHPADPRQTASGG